MLYEKDDNRKTWCIIMRIISGRFKNRKIFSINGVKTRPLSNNIQEAIFNILDDLEGITILELFAGYGMFSLEAISRGAAHSTLVEMNYKLIEKDKDTISSLGINKQVKIIKKDVFKGLKLPDKNYNLIFADPPFYLDLPTRTLQLVKENDWMKENGLFILRYSDKEEIRDDWEPVYEKKYGDSIVAFFKK